MISVPLRAGFQRNPRLELAHVDHQSIHFRRFDVRRVADDEVEPPIRRNAREQIAFDELDFVRHAVVLGIFASHGQCRRADVDAP